jgi:predicted metal-dependent HD superfamily phosphohydrolase
MSAIGVIERCWCDLTARRHWGPAAAAVLEDVVRAYREPHRHYHTLDHVAALLALLARHAEAGADRDALTLAILFHDVVYDPMQPDNEEASAARASERLAGLGVRPQLVAKVGRYILATRHGQPAEADGDADLALLLDLDLSILAAGADAYRAYAEAIRREYASVPERLYRPGRRRVLEGFLARERIYLTPRLAALWEQPARANLAAEIADLAWRSPVDLPRPSE